MPCGFLKDISPHEGHNGRAVIPFPVPIQIEYPVQDIRVQATNKGAFTTAIRFTAWRAEGAAEVTGGKASVTDLGQSFRMRAEAGDGGHA